MNEYLTNFQIAAFVFNAMFGFGIMMLPKTVAEAADTAGWLVIVIFTFLFMVVAYMITYLNYNFKEKTLDEYSKILAGKFFSYLIIIFYIVYLFLHVSSIIRRTSEIVKSSLLVNTPTWILCLSLISLCFFAINRGIASIARLCELYAPYIAITMVLLYAIFFTQGDFNNIKPFFGYENILHYIKSSYPILNAFLGIELLGVIPFSTKIDKKIFTYSIFSTLFTGLLYLFLCEASMIVIGPDRIIFYEDALIAAARRTEVTYLEFFRRIDGLIIISWLMSVITTVTIFSYSLVFYLSKIFKNTNNNIIINFCAIAVFLGSHTPGNAQEVKTIADISNLLGLIASIFITVVLFIILKVKNYAKKKS